jgi:hypothetical protein
VSVGAVFPSGVFSKRRGTPPSVTRSVIYQGNEIKHKRILFREDCPRWLLLAYKNDAVFIGVLTAHPLKQRGAQIIDDSLWTTDPGDPVYDLYVSDEAFLKCVIQLLGYDVLLAAYYA